MNPRCLRGQLTIGRRVDAGGLKSASAGWRTAIPKAVAGIRPVPTTSVSNDTRCRRGEHNERTRRAQIRQGCISLAVGEFTVRYGMIHKPNDFFADIMRQRVPTPDQPDQSRVCCRNRYGFRDVFRFGRFTVAISRGHVVGFGNLVQVQYRPVETARTFSRVAVFLCTEPDYVNRVFVPASRWSVAQRAARLCRVTATPRSLHPLHATSKPCRLRRQLLRRRSERRDHRRPLRSARG